MGRLARFYSLPSPEQRSAAEAALCLLAVRLAFAVLPFRVALKCLGAAPDQSAGGGGDGGVRHSETVSVARAVARAARYVPFRALCLQRAFAALLMLRRRGLPATVGFGLARRPAHRALQAHAWCRSGDLWVTGGAGAGRFSQIAVFTTKTAGTAARRPAADQAAARRASRPS